ncbi:MAG: C-GCAxxG-C-C family protein [Candidatus Bathyarchaeia archaeon]
MSIDYERVREIRRRAHENDRHSGCSQSVLLALQEGLGIGDLESFKAATVLSGGVARRGETCGALIGGLMALGLVCGRERMEDTERYSNAMVIADEMCREFQLRLERELNFDEPLESTLCRELQKRIYGRSFDLRDGLEREAFLAHGGHGDSGCPKVCGIAAEVAAEALLKLKGRGLW